MPAHKSSLAFFAPTSRGTEELLAAELREIGIERVEPGRGGVAFGRSLEDGYRACLDSRVASRVLMPLSRFEAPDGETFYERVREIDWTEHIGADRTLAVGTAGGRSPAGPPHFLALKTKDAIVDTVRDAEGRRPSVDTKRPDLRVQLHLTDRHATISLDLGGEGLHHRGLGREGALAPLRENLAAALLRLAGWPGEAADRPLFDPFCGSGTLLIEAAWMALDVAPGLLRPRFGAEGWYGHDAQLWARLIAEAHDRRRAAESRELRIAGSDLSQEAVAIAHDRVARAGLVDRIRIERRDLRDVQPPWDEPGLLVGNPPYGERLGESGELGALYELLGDQLRRRFTGWTAYILSGNRALDRRIGLRPASRTPVWNGPIECRWLQFPIHDAPVTTDSGPAWRSTGEAAAPLEKKLRSNFKKRRQWARREGLTAFRVYDSDIPEFNLSVDWYAGEVRVEEHDRPRKVEPGVADERLRDAMRVIPRALGIDPDDVSLRVRHRKQGDETPGRFDDRGVYHEVEEAGLRFRVNLTDFLETGLYLQDRALRAQVRELAAGRELLHLFAGTCAEGLAAATGEARTTTSVDPSQRHLDWGRENFRLNDLNDPRYRFVRGNPLLDLEAPSGAVNGARYDLVLLSPPGQFRTRGAAEPFDLQRDHAQLIQLAATRLAPDGMLVFWTHLRRFEFEAAYLDDFDIRDRTGDWTPTDFERRRRLRVWELQRRRVTGDRSGRSRNRSSFGWTRET